MGNVDSKRMLAAQISVFAELKGVSINGDNKSIGEIEKEAPSSPPPAFGRKRLAF